VKVCGYVLWGREERNNRRNLSAECILKAGLICTFLDGRISVMRLVHDWKVVRILSNPFIEQCNFLIKLPAAISATRLEH
jgi:hypothetical protein